MIRSLPGIVLAFAIGCADAEIPPIELGGSGARLMNGQGDTVYEAYEISYSNLGKQHFNVRRNIEQRGRNTYGARVAMERIAAHMKRMSSAVTPEFQDAMAPYIANYEKWAKALRTNTFGGSFLSEFNKAEREVKVKFNPNRVAFATSTPAPAPAPAASGAVAPPPSSPKPKSPALPSDRAEIPDVKPVAPAAPAPAAPAATAPPSSAKPAISFRLAYRAWSSAHDALVKTYADKKDCGDNYTEVVEALGLMKGAAGAARATKLQMYVDYYGQIHKKTKGFTTLPDKTSHQEILDELAVAARVIRGDFNPDK